MWQLERGEFVAPDGQPFERTYVRSPGAVAVVPLLEVDGKLNVVLVRQYRAALDRMVIEIPAGMRDVDGEDPALTAARELAEETGYVAHDLTALGHLVSAPGITDSEVQIFLGRNLLQGGHERHGPEEVFMDVLVMPLEVALTMVTNGEIDDSKTMIGLLMASQLLSRE